MWFIQLNCKALNNMRYFTSIVLDKIRVSSWHIWHEKHIWYIPKYCDIFTKQSDLVSIWILRIRTWDFVAFLRVLLLLALNISLLSLLLYINHNIMVGLRLWRLIIGLRWYLPLLFLFLFFLTWVLTQLSFYKFRKLLVLALYTYKSAFFAFEQWWLWTKYFFNLSLFLLSSVMNRWVNRCKRLYHTVFIIY